MAAQPTMGALATVGPLTTPKGSYPALHVNVDEQVREQQTWRARAACPRP